MPTVSQRLISAAFRGLGAVAPGLAGKAAYVLFCLPPRYSATDAGPAKLAEKLGPLLAEAEAKRVKAPTGAVQCYLWRTSKQPARGRVMLIHGWTAEALVMGLFVKPLRDAGFDVVAFDLPGHGRSGGRMLNMPIGARAALAVADAFGPMAAVITHSFGGAIAALALEGGSPVGRRMSADRLVLIASPHSIARAARDFGDGLDFSEPLQQRLAAEVTRAAARDIHTINVGDFMRAVARPTLVIHDVDDDRVPFSEAEALVAGSGGVATLMPTKGLGHARIVVMPNVVRAAVRFVSNTAGPPA